MRVVVTEERHNRVDWQVRMPVVRIEGGLILGMLFVALLVVPTPSPLRWWVVGGVGVTLAVVGLVIAFTTPVLDQGYLERLPEGGKVERSKVWLLLGSRLSAEIPLAEIAHVESEERTFEDAPLSYFRLARVLIVMTDGRRYPLTGWADPASIQHLAEALAKAGRLTFMAV